MEKQKIVLSLLKSFIIGICILIGSIIVSNGIKDSQPRYQMISHGSEVFIIDTVTGDYYSKFDELNTGPQEWTKVDNPFESDK